VWLDFGERPVGQPARVRLHTRDGQPLYEWPSVPARHIMGFAIPGSRLLTGHSVLIVEADQPMPAELVLGSKMGRYPMSIDLGASRPLSTHYWFAPPFPAPSPWDHVAGVLTSTGRLILPVPVGDDYTELELLVAFEPATPLPGQQALLRCRTRDLDPIEQTVDLGAEWIYLQLTVPRRGSELEVALDLELESSVNPALRIRKVSFTPAGWMDSVGPSSMRPRRPAHRFSLAAEQPVRYR
jgi:hypothetical protein